MSDESNRSIDTSPVDRRREPPLAEPESRLAGTVIGAAGGAAAGVVTGGSVGGPVAAAVGGAIGAVAGAAAGHAASVAFDPRVEEGYWRNNYMKRPYYRSSKTYSDYQPAYRYGWESASGDAFRDRRFEDAESDLERGWERAKGTSREKWHEIREAARDAWDRVRG